MRDSMDVKRIKRYKEKEEYLTKILKKLYEWTRDLKEKDFINNQNLKEQFSIYHAYQVVMEIVADLTAMVVKDINIIPKDDYLNFDILVENEIISKSIANNLKHANGLRNRIVHNYNGLDEKIALKSIKKYYPYFEKFKNGIDKWLKEKK